MMAELARRRPGLLIVTSIAMLQLVTVSLGVGTPAQPAITVLMVLTFPGLLMIDLPQPTDLASRIMLGIGASMALHMVFATIAFTVSPWSAAAAVGALALLLSVRGAGEAIRRRQVMASSESDAAEPPAAPKSSVSAIIPTRNRPELLRRAINAMLDQEGDHLKEIIVVFDQSDPDYSLSEMSDEIPIRVIENDHSPGLAGGRNTGIANATGDWIAFCDDDDVWAPDKLTIQLHELVAHPAADFAVGSVIVAYGDRRIRRRCDLSFIHLEHLLRDRIMEAHPSTYLLRRSAVELFGPVDEELPGGYAEDYDWIIRAARTNPILVVSAAVTEIQWHPKSYFGNQWETIDVALEHFVLKTPEFADDPRGLARILGQRAFAQAGMGQRRRSLRTAWRTWQLDWRQPRAYIVPFVALGIVSADRFVRWANAMGRGF